MQLERNLIAVEHHLASYYKFEALFAGLFYKGPKCEWVKLL